MKRRVEPLMLAILGVLLFLAPGCGPGPGTTTAPPSTPASPPALDPSATPRPTPTPEPIVPTPTQRSVTTSSTPAPTSVPATALAPSVTPTPALDGPSPAQPAWRERFGVSVHPNVLPIDAAAVQTLGIGWYLNWWTQPSPPRPAGVTFWHMVRVSEQGFQPDAERIRSAAAGNPGSIWLIGNEPDVRWQDNTTPERYAEWYGELYRLLKAADPTCRVAIGGVTQPTPLRLEYLDRVLQAYQARYGEPMPVDVWNVHNFILHEERGSWGVDIPPGFAVDTGMLYEIDQHDDLQIFQDQIVSFRRWMAERGQRDRPLVVTEYGVLMPEDYGFGPERVAAFMTGSFDFFLTAQDEALGYPADANRLVQSWAWFSLADDVYPTGNLIDPATQALTPLGAAFANYEPPEEFEP